MTLSPIAVGVELGEALEKLARLDPNAAAVMGAFAIRSIRGNVPGVANELAWVAAVFAEPIACEGVVFDASGCTPGCVASRICRELIAAAEPQPGALLAAIEEAAT